MKKIITILILFSIIILPFNSIFAKELYTDDDLRYIEELIVIKINNFRKENKLQELKKDVWLDDLAKSYSETMKKENMKDLDTLPHNTDLAKYKKEGRLVGENIAYRNSMDSFKSYDEIAEHFFNMWKDSKSHCQNMLFYKYKYVGLGIVQENEAIYATTNFAFEWTKDAKHIPAKALASNEIVKNNEN